MTFWEILADISDAMPLLAVAILGIAAGLVLLALIWWWVTGGD